MTLQSVDNLVVQTGDLLHLCLLGQRGVHEVIRVDVLGDIADVPASELFVYRSDFFARNRLAFVLWNVGIVDKCNESEFVL